MSPRADLTPAERRGLVLTKTERRRRGRAIRRSLRLYDIWQERDIIGSHPDQDADEQRWEWLLQARREIEELVHAERVAGGAKWAAFVARRG